DDEVVRLFEAVQGHVDEETRRRLPLGQPFADEHAVCAEVDVLVARLQFSQELRQLGVDRRLSAADRDNRCAALVRGREALLNGQLLRDRGTVLADTTAAGARQIARVQWL